MSEQTPTGITLMKMREEWTASLRARVAELEAQLPDGMKNCTIQFKECEKGHGRLTATNWIDHGCSTCRMDALESMLKECADDLACEIEGRYDRVKDHPAMKPRYERDMDTVVRARKILAKTAATNEHKVDG